MATFIWLSPVGLTDRWQVNMDDVREIRVRPGGGATLMYRSDSAYLHVLEEQQEIARLTAQASVQSVAVVEFDSKLGVYNTEAL